MVENIKPQKNPARRQMPEAGLPGNQPQLRRAEGMTGSMIFTYIVPTYYLYDSIIALNAGRDLLIMSLDTQ